QLEVLRLAREGARCRVEVGEQPLQRLGAAVESARDAAARVDVLREVVLEHTERRVLDDRGASVGGLPVPDRAPVAVGALALERLGVLVEQRLEVLPRVRMERREDLAQLYRTARLGDRERAAVGQLVRIRCPG